MKIKFYFKLWVKILLLIYLFFLFTLVSNIEMEINNHFKLIWIIKFILIF